ncbi:hypothetical protein [Vacuolonema iberomarrocanum]|uniref:hypothetical protein n=1 Tax=Vacuolonema iberomarrocanum TaxID=3454632 RepID=UPI0019FFB6A6|nr:hypothetical protein [filamentous cyanobacterium LEGE 07170]
MKRLLIATAIALLILAFTATAALAHGRHAMAEMGCCEKDCAENCAQARDGRGGEARAIALVKPIVMLPESQRPGGVIQQFSTPSAATWSMFTRHL